MDLPPEKARITGDSSSNPLASETETELKESKMHVSRWMFPALMLLCVCLIPFRQAHAYVDPGTGNYLLQLFVAGLFGALFALKIFWTKLKGVLGSVQTVLFKNKQDPTE
jgi:hypothetical protein